MSKPPNEQASKTVPRFCASLPRGQSTIQSLQSLDQVLSQVHTLFHTAIDTHHCSRFSTLPSDRETAAIAMRALASALAKEIATAREVLVTLSVVDVAEMYVVAGYARDEAVVRGKEDLAGVGARVARIEERVKGMVADLVYKD